MRKIYFSVILIVSFLCVSFAAHAELNISNTWSKTKQSARDNIYFDHTLTFYCGCDYQPKGKSGGTINKGSCNYDGSTAKYQNRMGRLEWEHVVPASLMPAKKMVCWVTGINSCEKGSRSCCEKHDDTAKSMIFDLHNLVPSIGQVNALRSNKRYKKIQGEEHKLGACDFEWTKKIAEPTSEKQGNVARIWLYMHERHGLELLPGELSMYRKWSCEDPPSEWEKIRNMRIKEVQGNGNRFIDDHC